MRAHDDARAALAAWRAAKAANFFETDTFLQMVLRRHLGDATFERERAALSAFGEECATVIDALAIETNRDENLPVLRQWDGLGRRTEEVVFHPAYHELGQRVYRTGLIARYADPGNETLQLAYCYLLAMNGEAGHLCPIACTAGLVKILQQRATPELRDRLLPGLLHLDRNDPAHFHGAQFLTEIQGGSDVGANACVARFDGSDWRISGEKWFCSVIDADLYLVTARPDGSGEGTRGLAGFVVPRLRPDGTPNGVHVRRLKYKLGTRSMASGEADFADALAWPVGDPHDARAFNGVVELVLNTSRLYNAVASCGSMRRVEVEATTYAEHRVAFGRPIREFPLVRHTLERIARETRLAVAGTFALAGLSDRIARGEGTDADRAVHRLVVNMNKYWTSIRATSVIHDGIEVLGGNGAIEDFSVLPRLYRDSIVCESWEGTHNVLCAQVLKDLHKLRLHEAFFAALEPLAADDAALAGRLAADRARVAALLASPDAELEIRGVVDELIQTWQLAHLP
jgi:alkylation response protein AidB-like acyl-CoA dehydrogenase